MRRRRRMQPWLAARVLERHAANGAGRRAAGRRTPTTRMGRRVARDPQADHETRAATAAVVRVGLPGDG